MSDILKLYNNTSTVQRSFPATADVVTDCLVAIDQEHHEIHDGSSWYAQDTTANIGAEAGDFISLQFTTPVAASGLVHAVFGGWSAGAFTFDLREAQTGGGAGGGAVTAVNRRRDSSTTAMAITKDDTVGTGGTVLFTKAIGAGIQGREGFATRGQLEWVLNAATLYQVRVYNAGANAAVIEIDYYIHVDKH